MNSYKKIALIPVFDNEMYGFRPDMTRYYKNTMALIQNPLYLISFNTYCENVIIFHYPVKFLH